jgi:hypothetical protein
MRIAFYCDHIRELRSLVSMKAPASKGGLLNNLPAEVIQELTFGLLALGYAAHGTQFAGRVSIALIW